MSIATEIQRLQTAKADLKTAIEAKGVAIDENATIDTYASKVDEIESGGGLPDNMKWATATSVVSVDDWSWVVGDTAEIYLPSVTSLENLIHHNSQTAPERVIVTCGKPIIKAYRSFYLDRNCPTKQITLYADFSQCTNFRQMVQFSQINLEIIDGDPIDFSSATNINGFCYLCSNLRHIRVVRESIKVSADFSGTSEWDDDSLDSIVDGLFNLTGATAQTLTLNTKVKARIEADDAKEDTDETKHGWLSAITSKNWTIA